MPDLVIAPEKLATKLGIDNPSPSQLETITDHILDCQGDVVAYLNRDLFPYEATLPGIYPRPGFPLDHWKAWPAARVYDDTVAVVSSVANTDGTFDVTFKVGLDGPNDERVRRYVKAHAFQSVLNDANAGLGKRQVTSVSAEGQSISYSDGSVAEGAAGALPNITTLAALRRRAVYRADRAGVSVWPLTGVSYSEDR